jgi:hypothetical protein
MIFSRVEVKTNEEIYQIFSKKSTQVYPVYWLMETKKYLKKRYGNAGWFLLPVILGIIVIGIFTKYLQDHSTLSLEARSWIFLLLIILLLLVCTVPVFTKRQLPGIFGRWQKKWRGIPTVKSQFHDSSRR